MATTPERRPNRLRQLAQVFNETRRLDSRMVPLVAAATVGVLALFVIAGLLTDSLTWLLPIGVLTAILAGLQVFSLRAQRTAMRSLEGKTGAAAAVLGSLRRPWRVTPAVAFNRRQDLVHLAVGRPGVVLVAEGSRAGATALLKQERRRVARVVGDVPIHELVVGDGEGQVPLSKLSNQFLKMPKTLKKEQVESLDAKIKALGSSSPPMPKGPIPRGRRRM